MGLGGWMIVFVAVLVVAAYASVATHNIASVVVTGRDVVISLRGLNRLWAFKSQISIPIASIERVEVHPHPRQLAGGIRAPGTSIPGVITAGTFRRSGQKVFVAAGRGEGVVLWLREGRYRTIVVETKSPHQVVKALRKHVEAASSDGAAG